MLADKKWFDKFKKTLNNLYQKEPYYHQVIEEIILPWEEQVLSYAKEVSISEFNFSAIYQICKYLKIDKKFYSSTGITDKKKNGGLQDITKYFNGDTYINAIGGQSLYSKDDFQSVGIKLNFIKMGELDINNPYVSILDLLFRYDKGHLKEQLNKFELI